MRFGLDLPPQQRVYGGFFIYSFCMGSLPPRKVSGISIPLLILSFVFAGALGRRPVPHEVPA